MTKGRQTSYRRMGYSRAGQVILAITPKITSSFSIIGSAWIVIEVITQRSKRQNVYNRLLFAMSLFDMLISIFMFMSTWPIPADTEDVAFASGNQHTCTVQGFILQFGIIVPICKYKRSFNLLAVSFCVPPN